MKEKILQQLHTLARFYNIETTHWDSEGHACKAETQPLLAVLKALDAPVESLADIPEALNKCTRMHWQKLCEPVIVSWENEPITFNIRLPEKFKENTVKCFIELENKETLNREFKLSEISTVQETIIDKTKYLTKKLTLPPPQQGYHRLEINTGDMSSTSKIMTAPRAAFSNNKVRGTHKWGVFIPLYAIKSRYNWGTGNFSDLNNIVNWVANNNGDLVGTLPILSSFLDELFEPSPYAPVSRLFWNEFYIDIENIPGFAQCQAAQEIYNSNEFKKEITSLHRSTLVDYKRLMKIKRSILARLSHSYFQEELTPGKHVKQWLENNPRVRDYARFRAVTEHYRKSWHTWPKRLKEGTIHKDDFDPTLEQYHIFVQWAAEKQLQNLQENSKKQGVELYLDMPLGVNSDGYDMWRERSDFVLEASAGAPPDAFFKNGQDWGIQPLHPERIRENGYKYYIECLQHHLKYAGVLRLDHVMSLHRLFWVPRGFPAAQGVYVHYRPDEFYALLSLESHRHQCLIVGEDLGTVPDYVREKMDEHNINKMYILPFKLNVKQKKPLEKIPSNTLASLNTHDMPPFAAFWNTKKVEEKKLLANFLYREGFLEYISIAPEEILKASLRFLASGPENILLVNLEDLWLETESQNVPGTRDEHPNWRRKTRYTLEEISQNPEITGILEEINYLRKNGLLTKEVK